MRSMDETPDTRLTEQIVVQESKTVRAQLARFRDHYKLKTGVNLSESGAVRMCIHGRLPELLAEYTPAASHEG